MYTRVESRFWQDEKMREVSDDARYLMLYLLTSPHRNIIGIYFLPSPYACFDLGWDEKRFSKGLQELISAALIKYDAKAHVVLVKNYLKHNPLENPNQVKSAIEKLKEIPETQLFQDFLEIVSQFDKPFYQPLIERLSKRLPKQGTGSGTGSGTGLNNSTSEQSPDAPPEIPDENPPEEPETPNKPKKQKMPFFEENTVQYKLALFMRNCILENLPNAKVPDPEPDKLRRWAYDIDLMIRIDNRTPAEIRELIDWSHRDQFWKANILSPGKLREKWDTLTAHKKRDEVKIRGAPPANATNFPQRTYSDEFYKKIQNRVFLRGG